MLAERKNALVILNPVAGRMGAKAKLFDICASLGAQDYEVTVHVTKARDDARDTAESYSGKTDLIVCCGGDGTLNETVSGIVRSGVQTDLCYVPTGSTNDFAASLGLPKNVAFSKKKIAERKKVPIDIGCLNEKRYFSYIASFGIFTKTSYTVAQPMKNLFGHVAYLLEGTRELSDLGKSYHLGVAWEGGETEGDFIFGGIANSTSLGGVLKLAADKVTLDDGLFEILLIKQPKNPVDLQNIIQMLSTGNFDGEKVIYAQSPHAVFRSDEKLAWCVDGEFAGNLDRVEVRNLNSAIRLLV